MSSLRKFWKIDFSVRFSLSLSLIPRHVVRLNRTRGRDLDCIDPGVCYHGGCAWKGAPHGLNARGGWNQPGTWSGGVDDAIAYMWGSTKETGVLTRALAGNLRFRQTSSALGRTFVGPPSRHPRLFLPMSPFGSRTTSFPGDGSPVRVASYRLWGEL